MDMDMDSMETEKMGSAPLTNEQYAYVFWYILAALIACTAVGSWAFRLSTWTRLRSRKAQARHAASTSAIYTAVCIAREVAYFQVRLPILGLLPSTGTLMVCSVYVIVLLSCLLSNVWAAIPMFWEAMALRSGYLAVAQLALLIALSTKRNIIGYLIDVSHERLIIYHRLIGVCILVTSTMHMGYFLREWLFYDVWSSQWQEMGQSMLRWGFAAWGLLLLTFFTSITYFRHHMYESWIVLHIATMLAFFAMLIMHLDPPYRVWAYTPLIIWGIDRAWRFMSRMYLNVSVDQRTLLKGQAAIESLEGGVTKITIPNFPLKRSAGQYVYLSIYRLGLSSHPFTIVSPVDSPALVLIMKAKKGLTRQLFQQASMHLPPNNLQLQCSIEGPYGGSHTSLRSFDAVLLVAGGTGATFTINLLRDLVADPGCCRTITWVWAIKTRCHANWLHGMLRDCSAIARKQGVSLRLLVYVTSDDELTNGNVETDGTGCRSEKCRCRSQDDDAQVSATGKNGQAVTDLDIEAVSTDSNCCCTRKRSGDVKDYSLFVGRPNMRMQVLRVVEGAFGETGIAVCGPASLGHEIRNTVVQISDARATKKGTGAEAIYLHVESQEL